MHFHFIQWDDIQSNSSSTEPKTATGLLRNDDDLVDNNRMWGNESTAVQVSFVLATKKILPFYVSFIWGVDQHNILFLLVPVVALA